jgi:hypothetical protein
MKLTPKNWHSFQHYKERKPVWIKLHRDLLDNYEFACLPVASRALAPMLWLLASEYQDGEITMSLDGIAYRMRMAKAELCEAIHPLVEAEFFSLSNAMADSLENASKPLAKRKQVSSPEKERETQVKTETEGHSARSVEFERFKKSYPSRGSASNPWKPAHDLFCKFAKQVEVEWLILSAEIYKSRCDDLKITGTEKVAQAKTWLHQERFRDYFDGIEAEASRRQALDDEMRAKGYVWKDGKWQQTEAA